jgi:hypothetical protein
MVSVFENGKSREATQQDLDDIVAMFAPKPATEDEYKAAIVAMMDAKARERRYDGGLSLSTYVGSTNPTWSAEATAFVSWRDAVWSYCYEQLILVRAQARSQPTVSEFLAELPSMVWPTAS